MKNSIEKEFDFLGLLRFAFPTIIMMMVSGLYTIVDSIFVSRIVGVNALSAINIVFPIINIIIGLAVMLASGGSAIIAGKLGKKQPHEAKRDFTFIIIAGVICGAIVTIVGILFIEPIIYGLGSSEILYEYCYEYLKIVLFFAIPYILQLLFQTFFVTAGKPGLGLVLTITAGIVNIILDYVFMVGLNLGVQGAAIATGIGGLIPSIIGIIYFTRSKVSLHFVKPSWDLKVLKESCSNGSSEMVTNLSVAVTTFLFNIILMKYLGEDGVAAVTIMLYVQFLLTSIFMGFSLGVSPVISYNYGARNHKQLYKIYNICKSFILVSSVAMYLMSTIFASELISVFTAKGTAVYEIAQNGFRLFSISFLFAGINIFTSALFTALSDGRISAIISFMRTFVFMVISLLIFPKLFSVDGIWIAIPFAEIMTVILSIIFIIKEKERYGFSKTYIKDKSIDSPIKVGS